MFVPIKNKKVYQHVIEQIQSMVMDGTLKKGDKLPSERELVEQLDVSRTSIREAMRALEVIGLVESRQGEGNFISGTSDAIFLEPLSIMFMLNKGNPADILELRMIIELESVVKAAEKIKDADKIELKEMMEFLRNSKNETESSYYDMQLHYKIAEITGNYLIITLLKAIESLMEAFVGQARNMILKQDDNKALLMEEHQNICDALFEEDAKKAYHAMKVHLEGINNILNSIDD